MSLSRTAGVRREGRHNKMLGERLALFRAARGLSLDDVGKAAGISAASLQAYETGVRAVSFGRVVEIARALDVALPTLLGDAFGGDAAGDGFGGSGSADAETGLALRFARIASTLPRARRDLLLAVAREMSKP